MVLWYYITVCILSFACCIIYYWKMRSSYSVQYTLVFILIFSICKINLPKWVRFIMFLFSSFVYVSVLTSGYLPLFYKSVDLKFENGVAVLVKEYGPLHNVFLVQVALYLLATIFALVYGWFKRPIFTATENIFLPFVWEIFTTEKERGGIFWKYPTIRPINSILKELRE